MDGDKVKLAKISSPMEGSGHLMCEVEKMNSQNRRDNNDEDEHA